MRRKYEKLAQEIVKKVGGKKNILKDKDRVVVLWADETPVVIGKISKG